MMAAVDRQYRTANSICRCIRFSACRTYSLQTRPI